MLGSLQFASSLRVRAGILRVVALAVLALSCGPRDATPVPEPPALQGDKLTVPSTLLTSDQPIPLSAAAGAAPPGAVVEFTDLDTTDLPVATTAAQDGSFTIPILPTGEQRAVVIVGAQRSKPFDFRLGAGRVTPSQRPACLSINPALVTSVARGETARFTFANSCTGAVSLANLRTRRMLAGFNAQLAPNPDIASGASADVLVAVNASVAATDEEVAFVDVAVEGQTIRYALSVYVDEP